MQFAQQTPVTDAAFVKSSNKTYTDCYRGDGFVGGDWGWGSTTNSSSGLPLSEDLPHVLPASERRLAIYILGWESENVSLHQPLPELPHHPHQLLTSASFIWISQSRRFLPRS